MTALVLRANYSPTGDVTSVTVVEAPDVSEFSGSLLRETEGAASPFIEWGDDSVTIHADNGDVHYGALTYDRHRDVWSGRLRP